MQPACVHEGVRAHVRVANVYIMHDHIFTCVARTAITYELDFHVIL